MKKHKSGSVWMILPLYIFTIIFVAGPLLYMVALSFAQPKAGHGVEWVFTLANYKKILEFFVVADLIKQYPHIHHLKDHLKQW
mgnify:CR=1 FL=1